MRDHVPTSGRRTVAAVLLAGSLVAFPRRPGGGLFAAPHADRARRSNRPPAVAVVNIHGGRDQCSPASEELAATDGSRQVNGMGTGVVIDERGYILTNYHVVDGVASIQVTLADGQDGTSPTRRPRSRDRSGGHQDRRSQSRCP